MSGLKALKAIGELKENGVKINTTEEYKKIENELTESKKYEKELIAEQHRLFDLAKEQEKELNELREFVKALRKMKIVDSNHKIYGINENDIALVEKVMKNYE